MVYKNETFTAQVTGYTSEGLGVVRKDGQVVFVKDAIAGEVCEVLVETVNSNAAYGRIQKLLKPSVHRVPRKCPYAKQCGGCQFWHMDYEEELRLKAQRVQDALTRLGGVAVGPVPILGSGQIEGYRNKAQYPVGQQKGRAVAGFYRPRSHQVIAVDRCLIQAEAADRAKQAVLEWMNTYRIRPYDEQSHTGLVRHIYVRTGAASGQVLVCLVINAAAAPREQELVQTLRAGVPGLRSVVLSIHEKRSNAVLGDTLRTVYGDGLVEDELCGLRFGLSPRSFYQVNRDQAQRLYELAIEAAALKQGDTVLDLYCGTGTITLAMARHAGKAIGVELVAAAIDDARENARKNGTQNAEFFCADAGQAARELADKGIRPDVIVVDPPRKGLSPDVIQAIGEMDPQRVVYVSCDPATLSRDVKDVSALGYGLRWVQAVDMFPRTSHVETVVLLSKGTSPNDVGEETGLKGTIQE